jgi:hypothetical protein
MTSKNRWIQILSGGTILALIVVFSFLYGRFPLFRLPWVSGLCFFTITILILGLSLILRWKADKNTALYFKIIYTGLIVILLIGLIRGLVGV